MEVLTKEVIASFKDAARKLTGPKRRAFEAQVTLDYLDGNIWNAEKVFGWSHHTVALGLNELRTGITCMDNFSARGNRKTEAKFPQLEADIRALAEPESQTDPKFQSPFLYTRMTAKAVRQALIDQKGWTDEELPHANTIGEILNRLGIKLRPVQKTKPLKKIKETEAIFANVRQENRAADDDPNVIRISMDAKAKVAVGDFSRDGESRGAEATQAWDHDPEPDQKLVPQGILDLTSCLLSIFIATSNGTSDFIVDCLVQWWEANQARYPDARRLVINLDNGPENSSHRTQFLNRMVMFADATELEVKLVYYPPYHSKRLRNFLLTMLRMAHERDELRIVDDQFGAPTSSIELADATRAVVSGVLDGRLGLAENWTGLYHMTCSGSTSWCGFASAIFSRAAGLLHGKAPVVRPISSSEYPTPANRPRNSVLSNEKL